MFAGDGGPIGCCEDGASAPGRSGEEGRTARGGGNKDRGAERGRTGSCNRAAKRDDRDNGWRCMERRRVAARIAGAAVTVSARFRIVTAGMRVRGSGRNCARCGTVVSVAVEAIDGELPVAAVSS